MSADRRDLNSRKGRRIGDAIVALLYEYPMWLRYKADTVSRNISCLLEIAVIALVVVFGNECICCICSCGR